MAARTTTAAAVVKAEAVSSPGVSAIGSSTAEAQTLATGLAVTVVLAVSKTD